MHLDEGKAPTLGRIHKGPLAEGVLGGPASGALRVDLQAGHGYVGRLRLGRRCLFWGIRGSSWAVVEVGPRAEGDAACASCEA